MISRQKRIFVIFAAIVILLLIPLFAMQFTDEVKWSLSDFIVAAILLLGTGFLCEFVIRKVNKIKLRITMCITIVLVLFIIWAELAVGILSLPFGGS